MNDSEHLAKRVETIAQRLETAGQSSGWSKPKPLDLRATARELRTVAADVRKTWTTTTPPISE